MIVCMKYLNHIQKSFHTNEIFKKIYDFCSSETVYIMKYLNYVHIYEL